MTEQHSRGDQTTIGLPIPATDPDLFRHTATHDILRVLVDNPYERFTIREFARLTDNAPQSVKRAVDVLETNEIIHTQAAGNRRLVGINRDWLTRPDDPVLRIPQPQFHRPVRAALERLCEAFDGIVGVLLFGSVAGGHADRQSDIDLWVLVDERSGHQHRANEIATELGQERFDGDRYEYQILVESLESARGHRDRLTDIFTDAITLRDSDELRELKREVVSDGA